MAAPQATFPNPEIATRLLAKVAYLVASISLKK